VIDEVMVSGRRMIFWFITLKTTINQSSSGFKGSYELYMKPHIKELRDVHPADITNLGHRLMLLSSGTEPSFSL